VEIDNGNIDGENGFSDGASGDDEVGIAGGNLIRPEATSFRRIAMAVGRLRVNALSEGDRLEKFWRPMGAGPGSSTYSRGAIHKQAEEDGSRKNHPGRRFVFLPDKSILHRDGIQLRNTIGASRLRETGSFLNKGAC